MGQLLGRRIAVQGTVQGVGFRPWVYQLAHQLGLTGSVKNGPEGVTIEAFGAPAELERLSERLRTAAPPAARVEQVRWEPLEGEAPATFEIIASEHTGDARPSIPADLSMCDACRDEVNDPHARRYRYPFTNCTHCGPRLSIARAIPYDRPHTTMAGFPLCDACRAEYENPLDRRFHAQPIACPVCGPSLAWLDAQGTAREVSDVLETAARALLAGQLVAVRGLGGFHLACDATQPTAVATLRQRKHREEKPFAIMAPSLEWAHRLAALSADDERLLTSAARPIVLAPGRSGDGALVGVFLPYTPLHELLLSQVGRPLVMTSGNVSEEPMAVDVDEAVDRLRGIADGFVVHDRPIATRVDDSVARVVGGAPMILRRARGFAPDPLTSAIPFAEPVLAVGGELKSAFAIGQRRLITLSPHVGELENYETWLDFGRLVERLERFLQVSPEVVAHDLHPDSEATRYARSRPARRRIAVQHHHAHVAAVMAEHGLTTPVLGLAFDGTGLGTDGTAWGGEFLLASPTGFERLGTYRPVGLIGGDQAIRQPWRLALSALEDAFDGRAPLERLPLFAQVPPTALRNVRALGASGEGVIAAHGVGRLFDAAGALLLAHPRAGFEAQLAMKLEAAAQGHAEPLPFALETVGEVTRIDLRPMWRALVRAQLDGVAVGTLAAQFHATLAASAATLTRRLLEQLGPRVVVLTGGCFANARLTAALLTALEGLDVRLPRRAPPGDGGLALGQAFVAAATLRDQPAGGA